LKLVRALLLPGIIIVLVLGSIYMGICTPTEAAGVGAVGSVIAAIANRKLNLQSAKESVYSTLRLSSMVFWLIIGVTTFSHFLAVAGIEGLVVTFTSALPVNTWIIIISIQIFLLILGMFMDDYAIILLFTPIFVPIITNLGVDPPPPLAPISPEQIDLIKLIELLGEI